MTLAEILGCSGGGIFILLTLIEIAPIKANPWGAIAKWFGRAINSEVLKELETVKQTQRQMQKQLEEHVLVDDERNADTQRERILQFNTELMRNAYHTREDFIEILAVIDFYEQYCKAHPDYKNNRAVHAVANIGRVYDERVRKNDFFKGETEVHANASETPPQGD